MSLITDLDASSREGSDATDMPGSGGERERIARIINPVVWDANYRHFNKPWSAKEREISLDRADAILGLEGDRS